MIIFSPHYPQDFLPPNAPKIAMIDDRNRRGWRLLCQLLTEAGGEVVVIPRTVSDHFMSKMELADDTIGELRTSRCATLEEKHHDVIAYVRAMHLEHVDHVVSGVDAIILPGNEYDVPPSAYGDIELHPKTNLPTLLDFRFETECRMATYALNTKLPILGICAGFQLLVTLTGGKLIQHLPDVLPTKNTPHDGYLDTISQELLNWMECSYVEFLDNPQQPCPVHSNHPVNIIDGSSHLARIAHARFGALTLYEDMDIGVLSIHHQGAFPAHINESQMKITAIAPDGVVEAVEHLSHPFCVATQFHPEFDVGGFALPLIKELIAQCKKDLR